MKPTRTVKTDTIEAWKAKIIEQEHIKELLEDIKAEIEELKSCCDDDWDAFLFGRKEAYNNVLQIIDKHIGKAESEDKK